MLYLLKSGRVELFVQRWKGWSSKRCVSLFFHMLDHEWKESYMATWSNTGLSVFNTFPIRQLGSSYQIECLKLPTRSWHITNFRCSVTSPLQILKRVLKPHKVGVLKMGGPRNESKWPFLSGKWRLTTGFRGTHGYFMDVCFAWQDWSWHTVSECFQDDSRTSFFSYVAFRFFQDAILTCRFLGWTRRTWEKKPWVSQVCPGLPTSQEWRHRARPDLSDSTPWKSVLSEQRLGLLAGI